MMGEGKKIIYLDCGMGAAGDMLTAALTELMPDPDAFIGELNDIGIPGVRFVREDSEKCGIKGSHIRVMVGGEEEEDPETSRESHAAGHHHRSLADIEDIVAGLRLSDEIKKDIMAVYGTIAEAESHVHGEPVTEIHFHEVGTMDAIADITAVCMLMDRLAPDAVISSPVDTGSGRVECAHGILPVPAPATAYILKGIPVYSGDIEGELCTPTGAALLKHFVTRFGRMPLMKIRATGHGMGKKDFPAANCVRAIAGELVESGGLGRDLAASAGGAADSADSLAASADGVTESGGQSAGGAKDEICELSCNVDDMSGEAAGFAMERLFDAGALDVYTIPVSMKKNRPGILMSVMCRREDRDRIVREIFRNTTTIGIRERVCERYILGRSIETFETPYGPVRRKKAEGYGVCRSKLEYEDLARIAKERGIGLEEARRLISTMTEGE